MGKLKIFWLPAVAVVLLIGWLTPSANDPIQNGNTPASTAPTPAPTNSSTETPEPTSTETPAPTPKPTEINYWESGLKVVDITDSTSRQCSFDMCIFLKLTALKTCSSITVDGTTYTADDEEVDSFSEDFGRLAKGTTRVIEFGTDASYDAEEYVDLDGTTCWK
ncbi:MAG: hypothetical protein ACKOOE_04145 [Micrococcales bacterium]